MEKDLKITEDVKLVNNNGVFILYMNTKENRFNPTFINKIHDALDIVEKNEGKTALITYSTSPKIYSNGLDLDWLSENGDKFKPLVVDFIKLLARFQVLPFVTIAAITGHAFAGGCMFACAHDYRIMNSEKGFICLPEIDINMRLPEGMTSVCQVKVPPNAYRELMLGKRIPAQEGEKLQLIDKAVPKGDVLDTAFELARELAPKGVNKFVMGQIKYQAYKQSFEHCTSGNIDVNVPKLDWRARL